MQKIYFCFLTLITLSSATFAAGNFSINPTSGSIIPRSVPAGGTVSAFYTVTNRTSRALNGYSVQGLPATVTQQTNSSTCSNPVNLNGGASCLLQLDITGAVQSNFALCKETNCTTASAPLNVNVGTNNTFAYVGDASNTLWQCPLNSAGSFASCTALINITSPGFNQTIIPTFQYFAGILYNYITDNSSNVWKCRVSASGGIQGACTALTKTPAFNTSSQANFHTFSGVNYMYVADSSEALWQCPMNTNGDIMGACAALTNTPGFQFTGAVTFENFSGVTFGYVTDFSSTVWKCPMNATGGFSGTCTALTNTPAFSQTSLVTFHTFSGVRYAYVTDLTNTVWQCPMDSAGNFGGTCTALTNTPAFSSSNVITFFTVSGTTYAYVGDATHNMWQCPIDESTGRFSGPCTALPGFDQTIAAIFFTV